MSIFRHLYLNKRFGVNGRAISHPTSGTYRGHLCPEAAQAAVSAMGVPESVTSGSLLLSAAHLARMNGTNAEQDNLGGYPNKLSSYGRKSALAEAVVAIPEESHDPLDSMWNGVKRSSASGRDATSVASSTHFTVVNGYTKHRVKEPTACCCNHSHQITVLVISMTILFSAADA
ncbi:Uncharacterized protein OBRU01_18004 [Operophtera brumata]|uniref:Uncharacterized protein n=1 Tax=Operophtera brumata TaxID=104452 RepID=A0A0L7KZZ8_OPEBR|nr:Uncharacterized protein OBRU01_18004 [Operophtera brumata]